MHHDLCRRPAGEQPRRLPIRPADLAQDEQIREQQPGHVDCAHADVDHAGKLELELALELELKLRFSLKEAVFKALFPIVQRHVGFAEVEVRPLGNGTCELSLDAGLAHSLTSILGPKMPFNVAATWGTLELGADAEAGAPGSREQYFLTTAAVRVGQDSNIYNNDPEQGHGKT